MARYTFHRRASGGTGRGPRWYKVLRSKLSLWMLRRAVRMQGYANVEVTFDAKPVNPHEFDKVFDRLK